MPSTKNDIPTHAQPAPLVVARTFAAAPALVFQAWSSAEHLRNWFCPAAYSVPEANVEFKVDGVFQVCMRSPQGTDHWTKGKFVEVVPHSRLAIDMHAVDARDAILFRAYTVVTFAEQPGGRTRMEVTQHYTPHQPLAAQMIAGAEQGWSQTLDRLQQEVLRIKLQAPAARSVVHASFRIERTYDASRAQVFKALTDPEAKAKWFAGGCALLAREMDVRPGGREHVKGRWESGIVSTFDAFYYDVVTDERIVYAYEMHLDERKISVSLATFDLKQAGAGTCLVLTEQGAFLDGYDDAGAREQGSGFLLDALGASLKA